MGFLEGPRRVGKSSLALLLRDELEKREKWRIGYLNLRTMTTANAADRLLTVVAALAHGGRVTRAADRVRTMIGWFRVRPEVVAGVNSAGSPEVTLRFQQYREQDQAAIYEDILQLLQQAPEHAGTRVALILDEFQEVLNLAPLLPNLLKAHYHSGRDLAIVLMGSQQSLMEDIAHSPSAPLYRIGPTIPIGPLPRDVVHNEIAKRFGWNGIKLRPDVVDVIYDTCYGTAQDIQTVCAILLDRCRRDSWWTVTLDGLQDVLLEVVSEVAARFDEIWTRSSPIQQELLVAIALHGGQGITRQAFLEQLNPHLRRSAPAVLKAAGALQSRDVLEVAEGGYRLKDPFFALYLQENAS